MRIGIGIGIGFGGGSVAGDLPPAAPSVTLQPSISPAGAEAGETLTLSLGAASGVPAPSAAWALTLDGADITDQVSGGQIVAQAGDYVLSVTWTNSEGSAAAPPAAVTVADPVAPPVLSSAPSISFEGNNWTITSGTWAGADSVTRSITLGGEAVGLTGTLTAGDDGMTLQVTETATNAGGSTVETVSTVVEYIAPATGGPVRTPTPATGRLALAGHSSLLAGYSALYGLWPANDVDDYTGQTITDVWTGPDGDALRADAWDSIVLSVLDDEGDGTVYDPDDPEWLDRAQHAYWIALEAADRGADMWLYVHPRTQGSPLAEDENAYSSIHYLAAWLESKTSRPVYVINAARVVRHMQANGVPDSEIFTDPNHVTSRVGAALGQLVWASITGAPGAGYDTADPAGYAAVIDARDQSYFGGFGGTEDAQIWAGADPLPSPSPRPGSTPAAPSLTSGPTISGTVQVGETLILDPPPVYDGNPAPTVEWRWQTRVPPSGTISTVQTGGDLAQVEAHEGLLIRAQHRASNSEGTTAWASTAWTDPVAAAPAAGDPDQVLLWTASGYDGPALTGNQPAIAGNIMAFDGSGLSSAATSLTGVYMCMAVRWPAGMPAGEVLLGYANNDPGNIFAEGDYAAMQTQGGDSYALDFWADAAQSRAIAAVTPVTGWHIVETWAFGAVIGVCVNGGTDVTVALGAAVRPTTGIMIMGQTGQGVAIESVYAQLRSAMPDATQRASIRAAAQALIP